MTLLLAILGGLAAVYGSLVLFGPTCAGFTERLARGDYDDAGPLTLAVVRFHVLLCPPCEKYHAQLAALGVLARRKTAADAAEIDVAAFKKKLKRDLV